MKDLQTLCRPCHKDAHKKSKAGSFVTNIITALFALGVFAAFLSMLFAIYFALFSKPVV